MSRALRSTAAGLLGIVAAAAIAVGARAVSSDSTPVGPLPAGPVSTIQTQKGELVAVALPHRANGRVWRIARPVNAKVVREVSEADVGNSVVIVFKAAGSGNATVSFGLTRGETAKAYESRRFNIHVR